MKGKINGHVDKYVHLLMKIADKAFESHKIREGEDILSNR